MKNYLGLRDLVFNQPHLCTPAYAETVLAVLEDQLGIEKGAYSASKDKKEGRSIEVTKGGTYVLPIEGSMVHKASWLDAASGVSSYESIQAKVQEALEDSKVKTILLDIDSSGGSVAGAFDLRDFLLEAKEQKPIYALARDTMASAAYLISSACTKVYSTQTGSVGSIGVVAMHVDQSERNKEMGIKPTFIYAGDYKVAGNPHEALEGEALSYLQESVNDSYEMFVKAVAEARGLDEKVIRDTEARVYRGEKAVAIGLADGVRSFEATLEELANISPKRVNFQPKSVNKGMTMDKDMETLEAENTQLKADIESMKAEVLASGFKITKEGLVAPEPTETAKEPEMIEVAGVATDKASLPEHVVAALEAAAEEKATAELKELATSELPNMRGETAMALVKAFADNPEVMQDLKAADALLEGKMEETGEASVEADMKTAKEKMDDLVEAHMAETGDNIHKARAAVMETKEGRKLATEIKKEQ